MEPCRDEGLEYEPRWAGDDEKSAEIGAIIVLLRHMQKAGLLEGRGATPLLALPLLPASLCRRQKRWYAASSLVAMRGMPEA